MKASVQFPPYKGEAGRPGPLVSYDKWRFNREKGQKKQKKATKGQGAAAPRHNAPRHAARHARRRCT